MVEHELRARIVELEMQLSSSDDAQKDADIEELRAQVSMLRAENRKVHQAQGRHKLGGGGGGGGAPRGQSGQAATEIANLQAQVDELYRANTHLQQSLSYKDKQLTSANAAATWAQSMVASLVQKLQGLSSDIDLGSAGTRPVKSRNGRSTSPASRQQSLNTGAEGLRATLAELSTLVTSADGSVGVLEKKLQSLDIEGRVRELEGHLGKWRTTAERLRGEVEMLELENRELRERLSNGGAATSTPRDERTRVVSPEIIRMPSHAHHGVNSQHWPVRSVAAQTPKSDDYAAWGMSDSLVISSPHAASTPRRARSNAGSRQWEPPAASTPPVSPAWPAAGGESPRIARGTSPASRSSTRRGLVSSAVLQRHVGPNSPFRRGSSFGS